MSHRSEWDEAAYLAHNPNASTAISQAQYVDGLHHFLVEGFGNATASCWNDTRVPGGRPFCIN